jgi:thioredoxin 1
LAAVPRSKSGCCGSATCNVAATLHATPLANSPRFGAENPPVFWLAYFAGVTADRAASFDLPGTWHADCPIPWLSLILMNRDLMNPAIAELDANSFDPTIQKGVVLVDFWAPWCGPCHMQTPILQDLARRLGAQATIAKVNVDEAPELADRFGIQSIPTLILFRNGQPLHQFVGVQSEGILAKAITAAAEQ